MSQLKAFFHGLRYVQKNDWAWIHAKVATGILCPVMAFFNPPQATRIGVLDVHVLWLLLAMLAAGGLISIVGLLVRGTRIKPLIVGYAIEMAGLIPLVAGPFLMAFIYLVSGIQGAPSFLGFAFMYTLGAILLARYIDILVHHLTQQTGVGLRENEGRT